jgi:hypothetical protein
MTTLPLRLALAALLATALACTRAESPPVVLEAKVPTLGKLTAPVAVTARLTSSSAHLTLRFEGAATGVTAGARGLDGLSVTAPTPGAPRSYAPGETAELDVPLSSPSGTLAVFVSGTFGGLPMHRSVTFPVGSGPQLEKQGPSRLVQTDQGSLTVLPAQRE